MPSRHPRLLLYGMYDLGDLDSAPRVRISMMAAALGRRLPVELITGDRRTRGIAAIRWLLRGGWRRVDAVYVESSTVAATPVDLAFLALLRATGRPVGVYFRDAYQLFRDLFPISRRRQHLGDAVWRWTHPILKRIASRTFAPTDGLAEVLGLEGVVLLPPGTDPSLPVVGAGSEALVAAILSLSPRPGFELLRSAMEDVRSTVPDVRLRIVSREPVPGNLPDWIDVVSANRAGIPQLLRGASVCVIPLPLTRYTELALPVRLTDYLSMGVAIVSTDSSATRRYLGASDAALLVADVPGALAEAIERVLADRALRDNLARRARAFAEAPEHSWDSRARIVLDALGIFPAP
jgi:glycosyltransferase involved in cell wall biosynthesis